MKEVELQERPPLTELTAISPIDGRYREQTEILYPFVSEFGLIKTRVEVEARYLVALSEIGIVRPLQKSERERLMSFGGDLSHEDAQKVKDIEKETAHDVKAMERALRAMLENTSLSDLIEKVHIGLTSEDINNISYRLMLKRATDHIVLPQLDGIITTLSNWADEEKETPMLARTHGQGAVPTTLGKEMVVFASRLSGQADELKRRRLTGKFSGAVGNFNALSATYPDVDWIQFSREFIESFGLEPNLATTQINNYEDMVAYFQNYQRINGVLLDFDQDMWRYISDHWFAQKAKKGEVGSSTMPQKVNPIRFENSEGNLGMANAIFEFFSRKLQVSRLQRDLSDSTVIRNLGVPLAYSLVAYQSTAEGMKRVSPNKEIISSALDADWTILAEGAQTILRSAGVEDPYSLISDRTRGEKMGEKEWLALVDDLPVSDELKDKIRKLTPQNYIGLAPRLTEEELNTPITIISTGGKRNETIKL